MNIISAKKIINLAIQAGDAVLMQGSHGIGKSDIAKQIAKENGYHIEVLFLALMEPGDLMGMPNIKDVGHTSITEWASPGWFQRMIDSAWAPEFNFSDLEFNDKDFEKFVISSIK